MKTSTNFYLALPGLLLAARLVTAQAPLPVTPDTALTNRTVSQALTWNAPTNYVNPVAPLPLAEIAGYRLYRSSIPGVFTNEYVFLPGGANTNYTWRGLAPGTSNYFAVVALNRDGVPSEPSPVYLRATAPLIAAPLQVVPITNTITAGLGPDRRIVSQQVIYVLADQPAEFYQAELTRGKPFTVTR